MIEFKTPYLEAEFEQSLHPYTKSIVGQLADWMSTKNPDWPAVTVTEMGRSDQSMVDIYLPYARDVYYRAINKGEDRAGNKRPLMRTEIIHYAQMKRQQSLTSHLSLDDCLVWWALKKNSFHRTLPGGSTLACDIRNKHYSPTQKIVVWDKIKALTQDWTKVNGGLWEIIWHDVGAGDHFHIAFKDGTVIAAYNAYRRDHRYSVKNLQIPAGAIPG